MRRCCVPGCYSNYTKPYVSVFTFPRDPELCRLWLKSIGRPTLKVHENIGVCIKHFAKDSIYGLDSDPNRKKVTLKSRSIPTVFEDVCSSDDNSRMDHKMPSEDNFARVQRKVSKSTSSSPIAAEKTPKSNEHGEKKKTVKTPRRLSVADHRALSPKKNLSANNQTASAALSKKASPTTDRPIIAVIKAEDLITDDEKSPEKMKENSDCIIESSSFKSFSLPSPFKNLPNVSVCLKEEDRVPFSRELKGVKRSPSTGSNSSTGSTDAQKSVASLTKRKKIEKPAPVVIGRQNDCYCWVCHKENIVLICIACPRAYHTKCAGEISAVNRDWVCPECQRILDAENVDTRSSTLSEISLDKLCALLKLSLNKMKQRAPIAFHQPVSLDHYPLYLHYVIHPMDFSLLERNIKQKLYGCTEAFLADVKWIAHNSCVFNGTQHPLSTNAKNLVKSCDQDMQEIEVCPDCFVHSVVRNKYWFSEVCRKPHPLVWAKLKGFPYWPAKVVRIVDGNVDARFFGAHDRAWVPVSQCYHLSKEMPTTSKPKKKGNYEVALDELNVHVHLLIQKFGCFEYASYRTNFNTQNKFLMYHGIDMEKVGKEDISIDNSTAQSDLNFYTSEKENRFANFMELESEKSNAGNTSPSKTQSEIQHDNSLKLSDGLKSFLLKERKSTDSALSEKEVSTDESNEQKTTNESDKIEEEKNTEKDKSELTEYDKSEESKIDNAETVPETEPEKMSDSDQLRKLELVLERIKGYVSLNDDADKEPAANQTEDKVENNEENEKQSSEVARKDAAEKSKSPPFFEKSTVLSITQSNAISENVEDVNISLQANKNSASFFKKLNATIESCKAKLGISEIIDDISSDESVGEENKSDNDEEDSSESEAEEDEASEEEDESDVMEVSDEDEESKLEDKDESADSDNEESESDSNSHSSDTDIECTIGSPKKADKTNFQNNVADGIGLSKPDENEKIEMPVSEGVKELTIDSNEAIITNPDMEMQEITIADSGGENSSNESSNEAKENSNSSCKRQFDDVNNSQTVILHKKDGNSSIKTRISSSVAEKVNNTSVYSADISNKTTSDIDFIVNKQYASSSNNSSLLPSKILSPRTSIDRLYGTRLDDKESNLAEKSPIRCKNDQEEEDDDIFICTPTRPKSPPVIVIDDDQENEESSMSDTFAIKSPPYSTSIESFSNEENTANKTNPDDEHSNQPGNTASTNRLINEKSSLENKFETNGKIGNLIKSRNPDLNNMVERRKRKLSSDSSSCSEDEIQIMTPVKKTALTGAIRTFNKPGHKVHSLKPTTPTMETVKRNLERESLNQINKSPVPSESSEREAYNSPEQQTSVSQNSENILISPTIVASNLSDKDKEILYLRGKLNCIMTAYKIQSWKCNQEREELRHNMNLLIMEMRASMEADKRQAIEALVRNFEQEKQKCIQETKRKQWCASCLIESRYACCWNTSYCSIDCQKKHFPEHRISCSQVKNKSVVEVKQKLSAVKSSESNENKKVIIVNMKSPDATQQNPVPKQIQVMPPKNSIQMTASTNSSNIQFVFAQAPVKSSTEPVVTPTTTSSTTVNKEQNLDSAQIIHQVRNKSCNLGTAITLLKKKNLESSLSLMKKKEKEQKEEVNLEDIYFPAPPNVTFEDYDTASPDPNLVIVENEDEAEANCDMESEDSELPKAMCPEQDVVFSDTDEADNEMINIGHGVDVKAKLLNKCLVYGQTAKKLTRCLLDIIFNDIKLLASCSAFGQKSNVTKLTRAALPTRKVHAIIDFVQKRYPSATRSEIVLAINMKCKEARVVLSKNGPKLRKLMAKKVLASESEKEKSEINKTEVTSTNTVTTLITSAPRAVFIPPIMTSSMHKTSPNVVCVKSSSSNQSQPFNMPNKSQPHPLPNILRCSPQILIKPKPVLNTVGSAAILQATQPKRRVETVKTLLANKMNVSAGKPPADRNKVLMAVDPQNTSTSTSSTRSIAVCSTSTSNTRPFYIIGSHVNQVKPPSSLQHPALPVSSHIQK